MQPDPFSLQDLPCFSAWPDFAPDGNIDFKVLAVLAGGRKLDVNDFFAGSLFHSELITCAVPAAIPESGMAHSRTSAITIETTFFTNQPTFAFFFLRIINRTPLATTNTAPRIMIQVTAIRTPVWITV